MDVPEVQSSERIERMKKSVVSGLVLILILVLGAVGIFGVMRFGGRENMVSETKREDSLNQEEDFENVDKNGAEEEIEYFSIDGMKNVGAVEFSNIKIGLINNSKCVFTADIRNTSKEFVKASKVSIKVKDENGEIKASFGGVITDLAGLEPNKFKTYVLSNITYAKDIDIEVVNE